jgi:GntR family transcriptional regulator, transcriptional repressor for pyruvate dehydrogenase complex
MISRNDHDEPARFRAIERTSMAEAVRAQLQDLIESGSVAVGERLPSEKDLARSFDVSRPVVREALGSLRAMGMVASLTGRGTYVTATRVDDPALSLLGRYSTDELYEVRSHLEIPGARLAAHRRGAAQIDRLREIVDTSRRTDDPVAWVRLDLAFHGELASMSGNRVQVLLVEALRDLLTEQSLAVARLPDRLAAATEEHLAILEAVEAGDAGAAEKAMSRHLDRIRDESHRADVPDSGRTT